MRRIKQVLASTIFLLMSLSAGADPLTPEKSADIQKLLDITGSTKLAAQMGDAVMHQLMGMFAASNPDFPQATADKIGKRISALMQAKAAEPNGLFAQIIPVYDAAFSDQELKQLIAFYGTDIGKKVVTVMPTVMAQSMAAGQKWGVSLGPDIDKIIEATLKEDNVQLKKPAAASK